MIRSMTEADLTEVVALYQAANLFATPEQIFAWTKQGLEQAPELNLVCVADAKIVGAISATKETADTVMIQDIAVAAQSRGQKIGEQLMQALLQRLSGMSIKKVELWVYWKNARAVPFYYRFGFRLTHIKQAKDIPGLPDGEELLFLTKRLSPRWGFAD